MLAVFSALAALNILLFLLTVYHSPLWFLLLIPAAIYTLAGIRVIMEYQRGIRFRLGRFVGIVEPGFRFVIPLLEDMRRVDVRVIVSDIPKQEVMTKDNVPVRVNAVVFFRVENPEKSILKIQNYHYAISQYGQTALRDVVGKIDLDELLTERDKIAQDITLFVDKETDEWGIDVTGIKIQDVELPEDMKRAMARQAEAEREKRATIIKSQGELTASENLSKAAEILGKEPGSLHLRSLQTLNDISPDQTNSVTFILPIDMLRAMEKI